MILNEEFLENYAKEEMRNTLNEKLGASHHEHGGIMA